LVDKGVFPAGSVLPGYFLKGSIRTEPKPPVSFTVNGIEFLILTSEQHLWNYNPSLYDVPQPFNPDRNIDFFWVMAGLTHHFSQGFEPVHSIRTHFSNPPGDDGGGCFSLGYSSPRATASLFPEFSGVFDDF